MEIDDKLREFNTPNYDNVHLWDGLSYKPKKRLWILLLIIIAFSIVVGLFINNKPNKQEKIEVNK